MGEWGQALIEVQRRQMADLHRRVAAAIGQLDDEDVNWRPNAESNSIAVLAVHLAGNFHQRLAAGIGGEPDTRDRDAEFNHAGRPSRDQVLAVLEQAFGEADRILAGLSPDRLGDLQRIRDQEVSVLEVLVRTVSHAAEHAGQVLYIAKLRRGPGYQVVSIPHRRA